jgi:hypothetical protein
MGEAYDELVEMFESATEDERRAFIEDVIWNCLDDEDRAWFARFVDAQLVARGPRRREPAPPESEA